MEGHLEIKKNIIQILKRLVKRYIKHDISAYAALMAFFLTLSMFPFFIIFDKLKNHYYETNRFKTQSGNQGYQIRNS